MPKSVLDEIDDLVAEAEGKSGANPIMIVNGVFYGQGLHKIDLKEIPPFQQTLFDTPPPPPPVKWSVFYKDDTGLWVIHQREKGLSRRDAENAMRRLRRRFGKKYSICPTEWAKYCSSCGVVKTEARWCWNCNATKEAS